MSDEIKKKNKKVNIKEAKILVTKALPNRELETKENIISISKFLTDTAKATIKLGKTISLGDYEFARVDVEVSVPCYVEEIEDVLEKTIIIVKEAVIREIGEAVG